MDYRSIAEAVPAIEAAQAYGISVERGRASCPFHNGEHKNLSFKHGRFHCFVCGESGDSINFTAKLFNLKPYDAARKLDEDFHLGLAHPLSAEERAKAAAAEAERIKKAQIRKERDRISIDLIVLLDQIDDAQKRYPIMTDKEFEALFWQPLLESWYLDGFEDDEIPRIREKIDKYMKEVS